MSQTFQVQIIRKAEIKFHTADLVYLFSLKLSSFFANKKMIIFLILINNNFQNLIFLLLWNLTNGVLEWTNSLDPIGPKDRQTNMFVGIEVKISLFIE